MFPVRLDEASAEEEGDQVIDADEAGVGLLYKVAEAAKALVEQSGVARHSAANGALWRDLQEALNAVYGVTRCPGCGHENHTGWCECGCLDDRAVL
jgi:hypothetical protein